jgi:hypothetical protein
MAEQRLAGRRHIPLDLVALSWPNHRHPVLALHQPLAQMPEGVGHSIDFRGKSLGNNGNVLMTPTGCGELGHGASCGSSNMASTMEIRHDSSETLP